MIDLIGYIASSLVFATFYVKRILTLRLIAICSNIAFIMYAFECHLHPVFILHSVLLPLNIYRALELIRTEYGNSLFQRINLETPKRR
ncbi:hypothetical protein [Legionella worsleiensis]|uniref:Uncharacterized protein n=1 Tax=Legionella worsleiensis TaxID=45076 RepID=A0A0W1A661_9GAMM|nr:hypothetical protein [Legionella worsleiensis]KTD76790.1 hypothetical protein Lwor_2015 [Legionella worsleiensis]STY30621.1 Uncharacterised protein [Legionella worsleiensis]